MPIDCFIYLVNITASLSPAYIFSCIVVPSLSQLESVSVPAPNPFFTFKYFLGAYYRMKGVVLPVLVSKRLRLACCTHAANVVLGHQY